MPTRAAAAAAAAANTRTTRSRKLASQPSGKENDATPLPLSTKAKEKAPKKPARNVKAKKVEELFCSCRGVDDGTPMVQCGPCDEWYHFRCIQLSEDDASEIMVYVCPSCQEKTGRRTVMEWEGPDALEPIEVEDVASEEPSGAVKTPTKSTEELAQAEEFEEPKTEPKQRQRRLSPAELSESSDDGSGDEYVDEGDYREGGKRKRSSKRRVITASSSDTEEDGEKGKVAATGAAHTRRAIVTLARSTSPQPGILKRKQSISATGTATAPTAAKRKRAESSSTTASAVEDAARKYCLGKFNEMFTGIFMQYPYTRKEGDADEDEDEGKPKEALVERKPEELTEEERTQVRERATTFAAEVEQAVFDTYAEPDKYGKPGAGVKYKERFRTLTFNLQKSDRVALHKRISSVQVAPVTLSTMSSTELASQEQQESIKQAEQEALEHSILVKTAAPRAKITHKGLQDIEDVNEDSAVAKQRERELEMADQERERERLARLRTITIQPQAQGHSNPPSASLPPESPVVPTSASGTGPGSWGAPPPVPPAQPQAADFAHTVDPELNLGDFIHMDDEPSESAAPSTSASVTPELPVSMSESPAAEQASGQQGQTTPITGISPFAPSKPDMPPRASFDLNALWSAPPPPPPPAPSNEAGDTDDARDAMTLSTPTPPVEEVSSRGGGARSAGGPERGAEREGEGGDDLDFAMFLGQEEEEKEREKDKEKETIEQTSRPDPQVVFEALPHVWNGIISMPIDSSVPQELRVVARQIGGRGLAPDSRLWRTLFPLHHLRIDGRVPVGSSSQYLLASRLNSSKELLAVVWTPVSSADMAALKTLSSFLMSKDRHGLIFPWGSRGREWGRELYVIPLLSSHALPEYIELLDELHLPKARNADCLVGIWVLNRGRLAALPPPAPPPAPPQPPASAPMPSVPPPLPFAQPPGQQASVLPPALASALASIMPAGVALPTTGPAALAAALSHLPAPTPAMVTPSNPAPVSSAIPPSSTAELAAQVASLTPDQIQAMLLALQRQQHAPPQFLPSSAALPTPSLPAPAPPSQLPHASQPPALASMHVPGPPHHWAAPQQQPPPPSVSTMGSQKPYGGYDEHERGGGRRGGYHGRDEPPRGRGRGGGRRGGGGNGVRDDGRGEYRRTSDAGWGGRGRGPPSGSPGRRDSAAPYWR